MSDCFDHALDAFDSMGQDHIDTPLYKNKSSYSCDNYDPLHYHRKHRVKLIQATEKAYQFEDSKGVFWVAKKLCKQFKEKKGTVYIWKQADIKYSTQEKPQ